MWSWFGAVLESGEHEKQIVLLSTKHYCVVYTIVREVSAKSFKTLVSAPCANANMINTSIALDIRHTAHDQNQFHAGIKKVELNPKIE